MIKADSTSVTDTIYSPPSQGGAGGGSAGVWSPQYYRESYFANDTLLHPELPGGRFGIAGDPVPYTVRSDNAITSMLIFCFVMALVSFSRSRHYILRQLKDFFRIPRAADTNDEDPTNRFQLFLSLQTCLLLAIISYLYVTHYIADTFVHDVPYQMISIYFGVFIAYFIVKDIIYSIVNTVFFSSKKNRHWIWTLTFITALEGIALFPVVMLQVYLNLTMQNVVYYFIFILILTKILTFYKSWLIFFRQIGDYLQIILYLCALEIIPLLSLIGILVLITDLLKVNI